MPGDPPTEQPHRAPEYVQQYRLPHYATAIGSFMVEADSILVSSSSELLSLITRRKARSIPRTVYRGQQGDLEDGAQALEMTYTESLDMLTDGDFGPLLAAIDEAATRHGEQITRHMFQSLHAVAEDSGQVFSMEGRPVSHELIIEALEQAPMSFTRDGELSPGFRIVVPPQIGQAISRLPPPTPEQKARLDAVMKRKKEEWLARQRTRRLPRQPRRDVPRQTP